MIHTRDKGDRVDFLWNNRSYLGYAYREVDGFFVFNFVAGDGWADYALRDIADKLTELNREWSEKIGRELGDGESGWLCKL